MLNSLRVVSAVKLSLLWTGFSLFFGIYRELQSQAGNPEFQIFFPLATGYLCRKLE